MLSTIAIVAGYVVLIAGTGWLGIIVAAVHLAVMLLAVPKQALTREGSKATMPSTSEGTKAYTEPRAHGSSRAPEESA